ncbi:GNAT family N-acetyltransferase [Novosphingobium sp. ZN18A2]|uniref:GNAT family N-acetyltransferase n=1 Tax=Novosphingobium sp. ZN18A2 TaxID=3079861 RepID=UPI0030D1A6EF
MTARVVAPGDLDDGLIAVWNSFCDAGPLYQSPFYRPQFTLAVAGSRPDARVAVLERGGRIAGFLPYHLVGRRVARPIGGQINDYQGPILAPGECVCAEALLCAAGLDAYDYNHLPAELAEQIGGGRGTSVSPQMDLRGGFDAYAGRQGATWRKRQRKHERLVRKTEREIGPLRFDFHDGSDSVFQSLVEMKTRQYQLIKPGMKMATGWEVGTFERLRNSTEPGLTGTVSTLRAGDRLIAAHFGMRSAGVLHWWFPTYDLSLKAYGPGYTLLILLAQNAAEQGIEVIDFGKGAEQFKFDMADRFVPLKEGSIARPGSLAAILRAGGERLVSVASHLPLGRYRDHPRRAVARLIRPTSLPPTSLAPTSLAPSSLAK